MSTGHVSWVFIVMLLSHITVAVLFSLKSEITQTTRPFYMVNEGLIHLIDEIFLPWDSKIQNKLIRFYVMTYKTVLYSTLRT